MDSQIPTPPQPIVEQDLGWDDLYWTQLIIAGVSAMVFGVGTIVMMLHSHIGGLEHVLMFPAMGLAFGVHYLLAPMFDETRAHKITKAIAAAEQDVESFPDNALLRYRLAEL